ncbi:2-oxoglutarate (2OG) and Fe(II)-dependent oxygenase superfamily protein [Striga hermonthica]|uniref:2-oxoglutarate (2OG) and Fe(II)-dependent oxygenase superfamily protein n=1 Tax=Striga hermonthica TaxID=68872 RepID=A0A9N7MRF0_STRHE|nr:2-oxoglutarate (2OG) and Fe(II)-dependent oxygenase superfamily protein [Striga hermonthica]
MGDHRKPRKTEDPFLLNYDDAEVRIAAEFLSNWLPFLSRGLCKSCTRTLSDGIRSLNTGGFDASTANTIHLNGCKEDQGYCSAHSTGSRNEGEDNNDCTDTHSLGSWKDEADGIPEKSVEASPTSETFSLSAPSASSLRKKSWADMALEDELAVEDENEVSSRLIDVNDPSAEGTSVNEANKVKVALSRDQREYIRFNSVQRKKDFICFERVNGKFTNILDGLELHKGVFSAAEQKRIVDYVEQLQEMGRKGQLKDRTYSAPAKWMRGKGRITLQFGCCYNYATDKNGNPPGILRNEMVDPLPHLFKVMIKRLIRWHVLPSSCVPDSCIVNIYEEGDCIPPHIDNHDFVRPFCTVSFLSECEILFGSNLKIVGPGEFSGSYAIPLPVGSVLVINGNGADVAKHCVPAVPARRISITFRRMGESKRPSRYVPEADLQEIEILSKERKQHNSEGGRRLTSKAESDMNNGRVVVGRRRGLLDKYIEPRRPRNMS